LRNTKKLLRAIKKKGHAILTSGAVHFHDHAHPHTAACTLALLGHFNWELFDHLLYSLDLASINYGLFTYMKN
jgi:hypothetical protein